LTTLVAVCVCWWCAADGATQQQQQQQQQLPRLSVLANLAGSSDSGSSCCDSSHGHDSHSHHSHSHHSHTHPSTSSGGGSSADAGGSGSELPPLTLEQAARLVRFNAFGDGTKASVERRHDKQLAALHAHLNPTQRLNQPNPTPPGYEDLAAAAVRGATEPQSHTGLWPAFAMFNHSCTPNTVHYVVGRTMVVRAVEDVPAGAGGRLVASGPGEGL
jgi:hypothetical protein